MMLSGARRSSLLQVRRDDVDLDRAVLTFRHMTTGGQMLFPMGTRLAERLRARMEADLPVGNEWLWPSATSRSGPIEEPTENGLPSSHEYRPHARTLFLASSVPSPDSSLLLSQQLSAAAVAYVHAAHLV